MKKDNLKIFVTGGKGFIGLNLIKELKKNPKNRVVIYNKDVCQKIRMKNNFDIIFHLAANTDTRYPSDVEMYRNNIIGFLNVLDFALKGKSKLIYASTAAMYGDYKKTAYAESKIIGDEISKHFSDKLPIVGLRFFNVFGPYEKKKGKMASMITQWALQIKKGQRPIAFGHETAKRDHIYVKDVVRALKLAIKKENGIYDVGTGRAVSFDTVLETVQKVLGTNLKPICIKNPYQGAYQKYTRAKLNWGFKPKYTLEQGIRDYLTKNFY